VVLVMRPVAMAGVHFLVAGVLAHVGLLLVLKLFLVRREGPMAAVGVDLQMAATLEQQQRAQQAQLV
jgi:hypothetical protein